jgi:hypothetical protein
MSGLNEPAFEQQGTEEQCRAVVIASRWPTGFECPVCGGLQQHSLVTIAISINARCRRQTGWCRNRRLRYERNVMRPGLPPGR